MIGGLHHGDVCLRPRTRPRLLVSGLPLPPAAKRIEKSANLILQRAHTEPTIPLKKVSKEWPCHFLERLGPEYTRLKQRPRDPKRLQSQDLGIIQNWYDQLEILLKQYQIQPQDLYNSMRLTLWRARAVGKW